MNVVEVNQAVQQGAVTSHRARLPSPGEWQIRPEAFRVAGPEAGDFAALPVKVAAQLAGNVEHARSAAVITFVEHVVRGPEIVRATLRALILRHFLGMLDIGNIHHVADGTPRNAVAIVEFENRGKHLVAHEQIILGAEDAGRAREPYLTV